MKWLRKPSKKIKKENSIYETCIICGEKTEVLMSVPIEEREFYIVGSGQLCRSCYFSAYVENKDLIPKDEMVRLLRMTRGSSDK